MQQTRLSFDRGGVLTRLRIAAIAAFWIHLLAGAAMVLILRCGLETNPNLHDRLVFIANHRALWIAGWLTWTAAAFAIFYFYKTFSSAHGLGKLALFLTAAGMVADLSGQKIELALPGLAGRVLGLNAGIDEFMKFHRAAVMLSGYFGNGMYSISALILAWRTRHLYPPWVSAAGIATGCFGLALSAAALKDSASGMLWTNFFLVPCILVWLAGVALGNPTR
jgi:hypothetical protein